jgi:hypothetical protein
MATFAPIPVRMPYHFEIAQDSHGHWIARDKDGLIGGVFLTQKDALRFALFEVNGDSVRVQVVVATAARAAVRPEPASLTRHGDPSVGAQSLPLDDRLYAPSQHLPRSGGAEPHHG